MAIRNKVPSTAVGRFDGGYIPPNAAAAAGEVTRVMGKVENLADDENGSTYILCHIPSSAILLNESRLKLTAWGFAQVVIGTEGAPEGLTDVARTTGGGSGHFPIAIFDARWAKPLWEQLGLAADPGGKIALTVTAEANATGAGLIEFDLTYTNHI